MPELTTLCAKISYHFKHQQLLVQALTHRSASKTNNERLEYLGDAFLCGIISNLLYHRYPEKPEGQLSRLRANLVNEHSLASIASALTLGDYLILGPGELKSGGAARESILADALEALFAAVFLDADFATCTRVVEHVYQQHFPNDWASLNNKDFKTQLQEHVQAKKLPLPHYHVSHATEHPHKPLFSVVCTIESLHLSQCGEGDTRRKAEQDAAKKILSKLISS